MLRYVEGYGKESASNGRGRYAAIGSWIDVPMGLEEERTQAGGCTRVTESQRRGVGRTRQSRGE